MVCFRGCSGGLRPPNFIFEQLLAVTDLRYSKLTHFCKVKVLRAGF